jgi:CheY-like chemotaxis protein
MRLLAVDDDAGILDLLTTALEISGSFSVDTSDSASTARAKIDSADDVYDCFLLDIQMPGTDGVELCRQIRSIERYKRTPIIMLTAMSEKDYIDRAFVAGATDYVTKPFDISELETRVSVALKRGGDLPDQASTADPETRAIAEGPNATASELVEATSKPYDGSIDRAVGYLSFENYILQMSRASLFFAGVFAVKTSCIKSASTAAAVADNDRIEALARRISAATELDRSLITYTGNGIFLVLAQNLTAARFAEVSRQLSRSKEDRRALDLAQGGSRDIVVVGDLISMPAFGKAAALRALHTAIENVEARFETELRAATVSKAANEIPRVSAPPRQSDFDYKSLLADMLTTEESVKERFPVLRASA